jgi:polyisoprenoid-binding protein YceI
VIKELAGNSWLTFKGVITMRVIALLSFFFASLTCADWQIESDSSSLHFMSVKNSAFAEMHSFDQVMGSIKGTHLSISIPLGSVNTLIPIRNERMLNMLFNAEANPNATFMATLKQDFTALKEGESTLADIAGQLTISGATAGTTFSVRVTKTSEGALNAVTVKPTVLNAASFKLADGVEALRNIAMLQTISPVVPVTFDVTFVE